MSGLSILIKNIANLVKAKTIVTLVVMYVFAKLALNSVIPSDSVMNITMMVVAFYFGTQFEKKKDGE